MAIIGIERLIYAVDELANCARYFQDFGLTLETGTADSRIFRKPEESSVYLYRADDARVPASDLVGGGVREVVWGCDTQASLERLVAGLRSDRAVTIDAEGVAHFLSDGGIAMGLAVFVRGPVIFALDPVNARLRVNCLNQTRKWRRHCLPKNIQHVVFGVTDHAVAERFMIDRLGFRLSDVMRGTGVFLRTDGAYDHHQLFLVESDATLKGLDGQPRFHHANFGVEDLDELMMGVNHMERCGWPTSSVGMGRHRLSSGLFCFLPCPAGGQAGYGTDFDTINDNWIPRIYEVKFSFSTWLSVLPSFLMEEPEWDWSFHPDYLPGAKRGTSTPMAKPYQQKVI